jgi:hypothetical protein
MCREVMTNPADSVAIFMATIAAAGPAAPIDSYAGVDGVTDSILAVGIRAYKVANAEAYRTVYLSTIAFTGLAIALTFFALNTEEYITDHVAATLGQEENLGGHEPKSVTVGQD